MDSNPPPSPHATTFGQAKKRMEKILAEFSTFLKETHPHLERYVESERGEIVREADVRTLDERLLQVSEISNMISRNPFKVVFFGRTSNGKSTVINALLSEKVLPTGMGHTTDCFVAVAGVDGTEAWVDTEKEKHGNVKSLTELVHSLRVGGETNGLVKVFWPRKKCELLAEDVVLVDSPGVDYVGSTDASIDEYCRDADIFVLVLNAESTINSKERDFFHGVVSGKPNMFVLNNRWDSSDDHDPNTVAAVRNQHLENITQFLTKELKCMKKDEVPQRTFFISARETMRERCSQKKELQSSSSTVKEKTGGTEGAEGKPSTENGMSLPKDIRRQEFEEFEIKLKECLCKSAVRTKFHAHTLQDSQSLHKYESAESSESSCVPNEIDYSYTIPNSAKNGIDATTSITKTMDSILEKISSRIENCEDQMLEHRECRETALDNYKKYMESAQEKLDKFREDITKDLSSAIAETTQSLSKSLDRFHSPSAFPGDLQYIRRYKQVLQQHMEKILEDVKLKINCSSVFLESAENFRRSMHEEIFQIVPKPTRQLGTYMPHTKLTKLSIGQPLPISYGYDIPTVSIFSGFQEDVSFRFSLGWQRIVTKFIAPRNPRLALFLGASPHEVKGLVWRLKPQRPTIPSHYPSGENSRSSSNETQFSDIGTQLEIRTEAGSTPSSVTWSLFVDTENKGDEEPREDSINISFFKWFDDKDKSTISTLFAIQTALLIGLTWKTVGVKFMAVGALGYSGLYLLERAMWTNQAKEKEFKKQLIQHTSAELYRMASLKAKQCSRQIRHDMTKVFVKIAEEVYGTRDDFEHQLRELRDEVTRLHQIEDKVKTFRNKSVQLQKQLVDYAKEFIVKK